MAITIEQEPYDPTPVGQKLITVASSTNIAEDGFRYKVVVEINAVLTYTGYLKPNPNGFLVFDMNLLIKSDNAIMFGSDTVHEVVTVQEEPNGNGWNIVQVDLLEAWIVDGVLTDDPDTLGEVAYQVFTWNATFQASDGYRPDPTIRYDLTGATKNWLSDRRWNTHRNDAVSAQGTNKVLIPVRETDFGVLTLLNDAGGGVRLGQVNVTIFDSAGAPHSFIVFAAGDNINHFPLYPANINGSAFAEKPSDYPGWRRIQVVAVDSGGTDPIGVTYILYNVDNALNQALTDCKHDVVRIGWKNYAGGWDYFNFTKRNENRITVDRKRYQKILGNYGDVDGSTDFNFTKQDSGLTELKPIVHKFLEVHSDWISEHEFAFLESLFTSQQVHWIHDDGTFTPVLCESEDYLMARERNGRLKNLQTKFRLANPVWV